MFRYIIIIIYEVPTGGGGGDIVPTAKCTAEGLHLQVKNKHLSLRDVI